MNPMWSQGTGLSAKWYMQEIRQRSAASPVRRGSFIFWLWGNVQCYQTVDSPSYCQSHRGPIEQLIWNSSLQVYWQPIWSLWEEFKEKTSKKEINTHTELIKEYATLGKLRDFQEGSLLTNRLTTTKCIMWVLSSKTNANASLFC